MGAFQAGDRWWWRGCRCGWGRCRVPDDRRDPARWREWRGEPIQQALPAEAGVTHAAVRVQDLEIRPAARRPVPVAGDRDLAPASDDVPAEPDPALRAELQPEPARLLDRGRERATERHRLQQHEQRARPSGERGEPAEPVPHPRPRDGRVASVGQVDDQQVHGPCRHQRACHRERLIEVRGHEHDEPFGPHATAHRLDGIEGSGEVQPRDDRARGLRLRGEPQGERRLARARVAAQRDRRGPGQPAGPEDGVERGKPGRDDPAVGIVSGPAGSGRGRAEGRWAGERDRRGERFVSLGCLDPQRLDGQGKGTLGSIGDGRRARRPGRQAELATGPRGGAPPARLERRERLGNVGCAAHRTSNNRTDVLLSQDLAGTFRSGRASPAPALSELRRRGPRRPPRGPRHRA